MVKARKIAAKGGRIAGSGTGGFLTGLFSTPAGIGAIGIFVILALVVIFREQIGKALGNFGKIEFPPFPEFPKIEFPEFPDINIEFPEFPEINITLPDFGLGGDEELQPPPEGEEETEGLGVVTTPEGCFVNELGQIECPTPPTFDVCTVAPELCEPEPEIEPPLPSQDPAENVPDICVDIPNPLAGGLVNTCTGEVTPFTPPTQPPPQPIQELPEGFEGGGVSFEGGAIFATPIENLSLGQIIDKFMQLGFSISASQAANIRFIAQESDTSDFDFGTNTGGGIGSLFQTVGFSTILPSINVSEDQFQGLSSLEIAELLTGGNISNF